MVFDEQENASDAALHEVLEVIKSSDKILVKLAEDLGIQLDYDGSLLMPEQRRALREKCLAKPGYGAFDTALREVRKVIEESSDDMLLDVAEDLEIGLGLYDSSVLTSEQRRVLTNKCLAELGYYTFVISEEVKQPSEEEILVKQAMALGERFDYDGSVLTPEQRQAVFKEKFTYWLKDFGLRSPQYYEGKSQCLSIA
jgi:hypothetical protein